MDIDALPLELRLIVLKELPDLPSLASAIRGCRGLHEAFKAYPQSILQSVLKAELGVEVLATAVDHYFAGTHDFGDDAFTGFKKFVEDADKRRAEGMKAMIRDVDYKRLADTHAMVRRITKKSNTIMDDYAQSSWRTTSFRSMMALGGGKKERLVYQCYYIWWLFLRLDERVSPFGIDSYANFNTLVEEYSYNIWNYVTNITKDEKLGLFAATEVRYLWGLLGVDDLESIEDYFDDVLWDAFKPSGSRNREPERNQCKFFYGEEHVDEEEKQNAEKNGTNTRADGEDGTEEGEEGSTHATRAKPSFFYHAWDRIEEYDLNNPYGY